MNERAQQILLNAALSVAAALVVIVVARVVMNLAARRWPQVRRLHEVAHIPFRVLVLVLALEPFSRYLSRQDGPWGWVPETQTVLLVVSVGWVLTALVLFAEDMALGRADTSKADNLHARRVRTQYQIVRRLTIAVGVLVTLGAVLLSFPGVKAVGASVLASAGLISVVGALAAQSTLANVFAGLQLAFSDAVRVDDVVVVEGQWGRIEEITLSYVVVRSWDDRRIIMPCSYFAAMSFENWTRHGSALFGTVELDLDWEVDLDGLRGVVERVTAASELWDERAANVQVTDALLGWVHVRVVVTARDAGSLFDLRCEVREALVTWVREQGHGLPRQRIEVAEQARPAT